MYGLSHLQPKLLVLDEGAGGGSKEDPDSRSGVDSGLQGPGWTLHDSSSGWKEERQVLRFLDFTVNGGKQWDARQYMHRFQSSGGGGGLVTVAWVAWILRMDLINWRAQSNLALSSGWHPSRSL